MFSDDGKKARLQEIGPRFTLKLKWLQRGTFDTTQGEYEWKHKVCDLTVAAPLPGRGSVLGCGCGVQRVGCVYSRYRRFPHSLSRLSWTLVDGASSYSGFLALYSIGIKINSHSTPLRSTAPWLHYLPTEMGRTVVRA